jgi:hypothetical protein
MTSNDSQVVTPDIDGPIGGEHPPFGGPRLDVSDRGYVVEEFQLHGVTTAYCSPEGAAPRHDGIWEIEPYGTGAYRTRLLVIRPTDPARFNGTVILNWQNVSGGTEVRAPSGREVYDGGFAWVGVSAQEVGIFGFPMGAYRSMGRDQALKDQDPERYDALIHPGEQGCFGMFHDAARVLGPQRDTAVDPLSGLPVRRLLAVGVSQSAMRLVAYFNGLHAIDPLVDGFVLGVWEGAAPRYEEGPVATGMMTRVRKDVPTPMIVVNSEAEAGPCANIGALDTETFRMWEVAGAAHGPSPIRKYDDDWSGNPLDLGPLHEAALRAIQRWMVDGTRPEHQPRIEVERGRPPRIVRDELGNAIGGIRLPELAAPLRAYRGTGRAGSRALPDDAIAGMYPSHDDYVARWNAAVDDLVDAGVVRPDDADWMKSLAPGTL